MRVVLAVLAMFLAGHEFGLAQPKPLFGQEEKWDLEDFSESGVDGFEFIGGYGEGHDNFRFAANWQFLEKPFARGNWTLMGTLTANYSIFEGDIEGSAEKVELRDSGLTPVWTLISNRIRSGWLEPFVEFGIGFHHLSSTDLANKSLSTKFQFGDHVGLGVRFGPRRSYRMTYQFQHLSNAGIDHPNPGINFHMLSFGVRFR